MGSCINFYQLSGNSTIGSFINTWSYAGNCTIGSCINCCCLCSGNCTFASFINIWICAGNCTIASFINIESCTGNFSTGCRYSFFIFFPTSVVRSNFYFMTVITVNIYSTRIYIENLTRTIDKFVVLKDTSASSIFAIIAYF